jgi:protease YdgD
VLTAAHCLFDRQTGAPEDIGQIRFRAGLREGEAVAEAAAVRAVAHSIRLDLALAQLAEPVPAAVAAPFAVRTPGNSDKVSVLSYAQGRRGAVLAAQVHGAGAAERPAGLQLRRGLRVIGRPGLWPYAGRARIVSIISAGTRDKTGTVAFGMDLPVLLADLKAALRSGQGVLTAAKAEPRIRRIGPCDGARDIGARFVTP